MFSPIYCVLLWIFPVLYYSETSAGDVQPYLTLYTPGDPDYTDILVRRVGDNLTLLCELKGDATPRIYVWNYVPSDNTSDLNRSFATEPRGKALGSRLTKQSLSLSDSGHVVCSAPPYSVTKFVLVQTRGPNQCARSAFWCGKHCVLSSYVCDGFRDCVRGEDEAPELCMSQQPCERSDKLNCSSGRCISMMACCAPRDPLCKQPSCCDEHPRYSRLEGYVEVEYPPLFEDRHAPDEYGFIQSTIYTVTACALIFMIAVVLLVSAICKMHMKRAALRSYTHATRRHYDQRYAQQTHRFPPCYEASRLLEQERNGVVTPAHSVPASPDRNVQCSSDLPPPETSEARGFPLAALSAIFTQRYRQIPTQCLDVEMTDVRSTSCHNSPTRNPILDYRSPTYCDLNTELFLNQEITNCGRELNYMSIRNLRNSPIERVVSRPRPLTLQLGRFQLSIPRLGRRQSLDRRPDTPNVAELNIDDLDFVRLNSNDTYTLNGRTIRLLGANFENYPGLDESVRPPPYTDAMRYKLYGPPPEYLSRDCLTERPESTVVTETQARSNIEMPPCYEDLGNVTVIVENSDESNGNAGENGNSMENMGSDTQNNTTNTQDNITNTQNNTTNTQNNITNTQNNVTNTQNNTTNTQNNTTNTQNNMTNTQDNITNTQNNITSTQNNTTDTQNCENNSQNNNTTQNNANNDENNANLKSVIDNLPAIDSDVNANGCDVSERCYDSAGNNNEC